MWPVGGRALRAEGTITEGKVPGQEVPGCWENSRDASVARAEEQVGGGNGTDPVGHGKALAFTQRDTGSYWKTWNPGIHILTSSFWPML